MSTFPDHLIDRYKRFQSGYFTSHRDHYERLASLGQQPDTMIVSCCDSRVDPEKIFDSMPGELFVLRNVANLIPPYEMGDRHHGVSAALEFAVLNLRVKHIVVLGHTSCGGVRASLEPEIAQQTEAQFISSWMSILDESRKTVLNQFPGKSSDELASALEVEAIRNSLKNLRTFPFVRTHEDEGKLSLHGAYFDIATGTLSALNQTSNTFDAL